jgi:HEAT repeat protein
MYSAEEVAQLVDRLNHPDADQRASAVEELGLGGEEIVPSLAANLQLADTAQMRRGIIQALAQIGHPRTLVPLMRFVFDRRGKVEDRDARGLAMQAIMRVAEEEHAKRLLDFLLDIKADEDPFVRGYALEALGKLGDLRALPILRAALEDPEPFVKERAQLALAELEELRAYGGDAAGSDVLAQDDLGDDALLAKIRGSKSGDREYYMRELISRPHAFELAVRLTQEGGLGTMLGLQILQQLGDPRAREVARQRYMATENADEQAVCMRLIAQYMQGDAHTGEIPLIEAAFVHKDLLVRLAALDAAGSSGHEPLMRKALRATAARDVFEVLTAARALERGVSGAQRRLLPDVRDAWSKVHARRVSERDSAELAQAEAHLLGAMGKLVDARTPGVSSVQRDALAALTDAGTSEATRPILVAALRLLRDTTPEQGLSEETRWSQLEAAALVPLVDHPEERVRNRALDLLLRGGPPAMLELGPKLERLAMDESIDRVRVLIPLAVRTGGERCKRLLEDFARVGEGEVREAAEAGLRFMRNMQPFIDVHFSK